MLVVNRRVLIRMKCSGAASARCRGSLSLTPTAGSRRPRTAAASRASFDVAAGRSAAVKVRPSAKLRKLLRTRGKVVVTAVVRLRVDGGTTTFKRRLTVVAGRR